MISGELKRKLIGLAVILSCVLSVVAHLTGWIHSIVFVNELSLAALIISFGAWWDAQGAKVAAEEEGDAEGGRR